MFSEDKDFRTLVHVLRGLKVLDPTSCFQRPRILGPGSCFQRPRFLGLRLMFS